MPIKRSPWWSDCDECLPVFLCACDRKCVERVTIYEDSGLAYQSYYILFIYVEMFHICFIYDSYKQICASYMSEGYCLRST